MTFRTRLVAGCILASELVACAASNSELERRMDALSQLLIDVEERGALRCAPRQLAIAQSQLRFSQMERSQGFASRAERHLEIAERHARAADRLSPADRCAEPPATAPDA